MSTRHAIFLDRDGTLNRDVGYAHRVEDLELLPNAVAGLTRMAALGFRLIIVTNQSGIARGYFSEDDMREFNAALVQRLAADGVEIDAIYYCPFHPTEGVADYRRESRLRKPNAGMIEMAVAEHNLDLAGSYAIGDKKSDILAGRHAGCRTILVRTCKGGRGEGELAAHPDYVANDLLDAAKFIEHTSRKGTYPLISA